MRKTIPATKLTPPIAAISTRKPAPPSERWGVMRAQNSAGSSAGALRSVMRLQYRRFMAKITTPRRPAASPATSGSRARPAPNAGTGAQSKARPKTKAKTRPKPWAPAEIEEAFRRFQAANPAPRGELAHINPYTLLVAVVLSAQATDASVNKATPALFAAADTPARMVALGESRLRDLIKTIGLFRTKAKNLIGLSRLLIERHGGEVPRTREELEALPGVGRKTANVVLNIAFGEPTIAVDTHIFRIGNRTGLAPGKTV